MNPRDAAAIQLALDALPAKCRYHGDNLEREARWGGGACYDTGKPALYRRDAEAALKRARGDE